MTQFELRRGVRSADRGGGDEMRFPAPKRSLHMLPGRGRALACPPLARGGALLPPHLHLSAARGQAVGVVLFDSAPRFGRQLRSAPAPGSGGPQRARVPGSRPRRSGSAHHSHPTPPHPIPDAARRPRRPPSMHLVLLTSILA